MEFTGFDECDFDRADCLGNLDTYAESSLATAERCIGACV